MLPQGAWVKIVGFVRQAETSHVQGLFGLNELGPKNGLCFFLPLFYRSFPIFRHNFYITSKKNNVKCGLGPNPPPPLWTKGSCTKKKSGLTLELFQRGGGGQGPIQSKRGTFCHRQVPTRISFILPHIHGGASLFIPHKFNPWTLTMC